MLPNLFISLLTVTIKSSLEAVAFDGVNILDNFVLNFKYIQNYVGNFRYFQL